MPCRGSAPHVPHTQPNLLYPVCQHTHTRRAVANLAVALLSLEESEDRLLDLLARARNPLGKPLFDPKYALRLAKERNRCVRGGVLLWQWLEEQAQCGGAGATHGCASNSWRL